VLLGRVPALLEVLWWHRVFCLSILRLGVQESSRRFREVRCAGCILNWMIVTFRELWRPNKTERDGRRPTVQNLHLLLFRVMYESFGKAVSSIRIEKGLKNGAQFRFYCRVIYWCLTGPFNDYCGSAIVPLLLLLLWIETLRLKLCFAIIHPGERRKTPQNNFICYLTLNKRGIYARSMANGDLGRWHEALPCI